MNISVEDLGPCRKLLRIEVPVEKVKESFEKATLEYQKHGKIQGFRPGKAPLAMILKTYGSDIEQSVKEELIKSSLRKAFIDHKMEVIERLSLEVQQFGKDQALEFTSTVEILPKFEVPEVKGLEVKIPSREVTDEDVEKALTALREQKASFNTVDRVAQMGDIVVVNYTGTTDGKPLIEVAPSARGLTEQKNYWLELKTGSFIPGFIEQLQGVKAQDRKVVDVTYPADFVISELVGKAGKYDVEVVEVKERTLPALDDAFAKTFGAEGLDALKQGVRRDLETDLNRKKAEMTRSQLLDVLLKQVQFDLPDSLLQSQTKDEVYDIVYQNQRRGVDSKTIEENKDKIFTTASATANNRLKVKILLNRIAQKEKISVTQEELQTQVAYMAHQNKTPVIKYLRDLEKKGYLPQLEENMLFEKTLNFLAKSAKIEEIAEPASPVAS